MCVEQEIVSEVQSFFHSSVFSVIAYVLSLLPQDSESSEIDGDKSSTLVEKGEGQSLSGTVLIEGQSSP